MIKYLPACAINICSTQKIAFSWLEANHILYLMHLKTKNEAAVFKTLLGKWQ